MTIAVQIENLDDARAIEVLGMDYDKDQRQTTVSLPQWVGPKGKTIVYVHLLHDVKIREVEPL